MNRFRTNATDQDTSEVDVPYGATEGDVVFFPYSDLDHEELEDTPPEKLTIMFMTEVLQWFVGFLMHGDKGKSKSVKVGFKRLLAMVYILRPDLIDGKTLEEITSELGESRNALSRWTGELTYMFQLKGPNQKTFRSRVQFYLAQLTDWDEQRRDQLPKTFDAFIERGVQMEKRNEELEAELDYAKAEIARLKRVGSGDRIPAKM